MAGLTGQPDMQATNATQSIDGSSETIQQPFIEANEPDLPAFLANVSRLDGVQAVPKPEAHCCGAVGCRLEVHLAQVGIQGFGKRVLCPKHVLDLVDREVGLDE